MTNRARATLKALQLLGNSVRGLSWTNWRMVYNAVILLILIYAAPVRFSGQAGLLRQLRTAQNAAVRHIAGAFGTIPTDPLHQLMSIMPIDLRLRLLIKNASLRLYGIPTNSQLAARIPGSWGLRIHGLISLPIQPPRRSYRSSLLSLTANLPTTPHIDLLAAPPWNLDFAHPRFIANHRIRHNDEQKIWANTIEDLTSKPDHLTIFTRGSKTNHNRNDNQMLSTCIAVAFSTQTEIEHSSRTLGVSATACATLVRLITAHAFIGEYTARFHPRKPTSCPECGANPQTVAHVIRHGPRFVRARAAHLIPIAPDLSLSTLFGTKEGKALLHFLEVTKACFKPSEEPPTQDDSSHRTLSPPLLLTCNSDQKRPLSYHVHPASFARIAPIVTLNIS